MYRARTKPSFCTWVPGSYHIPNNPPNACYSSGGRYHNQEGTDLYVNLSHGASYSSSLSYDIEKKVFLPSFSFFRVYENEVLFLYLYSLYFDCDNEVLYTLPRILQDVFLRSPMLEHVLDKISISM